MVPPRISTVVVPRIVLDNINLNGDNAIPHRITSTAFLTTFQKASPAFMGGNALGVPCLTYGLPYSNPKSMEFRDIDAGQDLPGVLPS